MAIAELEATETLVRKERSLLQESWIRLKRNKVAVIALIFITLLVLTAIFANFVAPFDYATQDLLKNNAVPKWMLFLLPENAENYATFSEKFPLGADHLGRDLLSRALYGARVSLVFAFVASLVSLIIGTIYGMISGYVGGRLDDIMMRIVDFLYAFPFLVVVILLQTYFKAIERRGGGGFVFDLNAKMGGMFFLFIAIGLIDWIGMARIARGSGLQEQGMGVLQGGPCRGARGPRLQM